MARLEQQRARRLHWVLLAEHLHLVITLVLLEAAAEELMALVLVAAAPVVEAVAHLGLDRLLVEQLGLLAAYLLAGILGQTVLPQQTLLTT